MQLDQTRVVDEDELGEVEDQGSGQPGGDGGDRTTEPRSRAPVDLTGQTEASVVVEGETVGRIGLGQSPSDPDQLYAVVNKTSGPFEGFYRSTDGGYRSSEGRQL